MSGARGAGRAPILASVGLLLGVLVVLQLGSPEPGLLYLAPALLLLVPLAFDRYPGERLLAVLARAWHALQRGDGPAPHRARTPLLSLPRGSALLAMALAGRGPPG